jgi:hypothetical protein
MIRAKFMPKFVGGFTIEADDGYSVEEMTRLELGIRKQ